jgi:hypothetical protein
MKQLILTSATILFVGASAFAQNLRYELHGAYQRAVKKGNIGESQIYQ